MGTASKRARKSIGTDSESEDFNDMEDEQLMVDGEEEDEGEDMDDEDGGDEGDEEEEEEEDSDEGDSEADEEEEGVDEEDEVGSEEEEEDDEEEDGDEQNNTVNDGEMEDLEKEYMDLRRQEQIGGAVQRVDQGKSSQTESTRSRTKPKENTNTNTKFSVALKKEEIEADFIAMTGSNPSRRPRKRTKRLQRRLDSSFPGLRLDTITPSSYEVSDKPKNCMVNGNPRA
ncbi:hypothetical protein HS088_TW08G00876 [Tripterygium wilfordii]|uniref:Uncharacterized protein n=1 Tax=Tripterygium wilfordii TaxID=458696 RepID=A0A7J7DDX4_TRIWF|nr:hypothetical protein HS088_TW08G00876 [Tripterygium wilfordii]